MRDSLVEPCYPPNSSLTYLDPYKYEPQWDSSYYPLDSRENIDPYLNTYASIEPPSYQGLHYHDDESSIDLSSISKIRPTSVEDWTASHIMSWIIEIYDNEGFSYEPVNMHLLRNYNGSDLLKFPEYRFYEIHESKARWLYQKVRDLAMKSDPTRITYSDPTFTVFGKSEPHTFSSGSDCETEPVKQKKRGRPRSLNKIRRKSEHKTGKLWEFLRDLLLNPEYCPSLICWENHDEGVFRFVCSDKVAKIWGSKRGNTEMNYEKLSRAMRYYYKNKVLLPVLGKRLVYKFGPNAVGWRTNNPNFEN